MESVDLHRETVVVKGRVLLENDRFLQVYFNEQTGTIAYALIEDEHRFWGVDYDSLRGWHEHPLNRSAQHRDVSPMTPRDVVEALMEDGTACRKHLCLSMTPTRDRVRTAG